MGANRGREWLLWEAAVGDWGLICGEAMATLESMPDNSVNAIVTDPPYSSGGGMGCQR